MADLHHCTCPDCAEERVAQVDRLAATLRTALARVAELEAEGERVRDERDEANRRLEFARGWYRYMAECDRVTGDEWANLWSCLK